MKLAELDSRQHKGGRNPVLGHADMIAHWSRFGAAHVDALQRGKFKPHHPELAYPLIEGESDKERIFGVYAAETAVSTSALDKPVGGASASGSVCTDSLVVEIPAKAKIVPYDTYGINGMGLSYEAGCHRVSVPPSGYLLITQEAQR